MKAYEIQGKDHPIIDSTVQAIMFTTDGALLFTKEGKVFMFEGTFKIVEVVEVCKTKLS